MITVFAVISLFSLIFFFVSWLIVLVFVVLVIVKEFSAEPAPSENCLRISVFVFFFNSGVWWKDATEMVVLRIGTETVYIALYYLMNELRSKEVKEYGLC